MLGSLLNAEEGDEEIEDEDATMVGPAPLLRAVVVADDDPSGEATLISARDGVQPLLLDRPLAAISLPAGRNVVRAGPEFGVEAQLLADGLGDVPDVDEDETKRLPRPTGGPQRAEGQRLQRPARGEAVSGGKHRIGHRGTAGEATHVGSRPEQARAVWLVTIVVLLVLVAALAVLLWWISR